MTTQEKISKISMLNTSDIISEVKYYEILEECDMLVTSYGEYMTTHPINCDEELARLPNADFDTCCALLTMLLREDYFSNGSFIRRQRVGQVKPIVERILLLLSSFSKRTLKQFSEKALIALDGYYVYALIDPRTDKVFYIGKGIGNRVFDHEIESEKNVHSEKEKLKRIQEIEKSGYEVKRIIINWGMTENEAFASEASLINLMRLISSDALTNIVSGHHVHEAITVEEFELLHGAENLKHEDLKHGVMVIKINKLYRRDMTVKELYDIVRGHWRASLNTIRRLDIKYVFGVYNQLIVAVYKPDEWHYVHEMIDVPRAEDWNEATFNSVKDRVYFICKDYEHLDPEGEFYLHKSIAELKVNQSAQNPITYLTPLA